MFKKEDITLLIILSTIILIFLIIVVVIIIVRYKIRQRQFYFEKQQLQSQFSQTLLQSQLEIKEQTLRHLAYELHDNLGQIASLIKINLNTIQLDDREKSAQKIEDTKELTRQLITDLKSLSVSLNGDLIAKIGLLKGIENEVTRLNKTGQFITQLKVEGLAAPLDESTTIILYRMVQEVINNIVKHSEAKHIEFLVTTSENLFTLVIRDDGVGFNLEEKINSGGSGLLNLQSRAKLIYAQFSIQSSPGVGTKICIELPLTPHADPTNR
jgi:two-component system, NarL family, sensor kinase